MRTTQLIIFIACICLVRQARANDFYLNYDYGSDAANGSSTATAWQTWNKIKTYGDASHYSPGDTISLLRGDSWYNATSWWGTGAIMGTGTADNPIVLGAWGTSTDRPIVEVYGTSTLAMSFRNMSYWTIRDLDFKGGTWAVLTFRPEANDMVGLKVLNCDLYSGASSIFHWLRIGELEMYEISDVEIGSCTVHGDTPLGGNHDFVNLEKVKSNGWIHDIYGYNGSEMGSLADIAGGDGHIFEYNIGSGIGSLVKMHTQQYVMENSVARYSLLYGTLPSATSNNIGANLVNTINCEVYNLTLNMGTSGVSASMVWDNPSQVPLAVGNPTQNLKIQNNIFYGSRASEAAFSIKDIPMDVFNATVDCDHNLYYKTNGNMIKYTYDTVPWYWRTSDDAFVPMNSIAKTTYEGTISVSYAINVGSGSAAWLADHPGDLLQVDPLWVDPDNDDYRLRWNSPCIDAGIAVNATHTQSLDLDKNPIYGTPDIGCYEYQPPFTIGTDAIDTTGTIRMYSNGKYRYKTGTSSGTLASLDIYQAAGRLSGTYSQWLDLSFTSWTANNKAWTETPGYGTNTTHIISGLTDDYVYAIVVNGATQTTKIASGGNIAFDYTGGYTAPVNFEVNVFKDSGISASGSGNITCSGSGNITVQ